MKTVLKLLTLTCFLTISSYCFAEEDVYVEDSVTNDYVETSDIKEEVVKSKTETSTYEYDIDVYPYMSISVKNTKTVKEDK